VPPLERDDAAGSPSVGRRVADDLELTADASPERMGDDSGHDRDAGDRAPSPILSAAAAAGGVDVNGKAETSDRPTTSLLRNAACGGDRPDDRRRYCAIQ